MSNEEIKLPEPRNYMIEAALDAVVDKAFKMSFVEQAHIEHVMAYCKGNKTEAAKLLGIGRATLFRKIAKYEKQRRKENG